MPEGWQSAATGLETLDPTMSRLALLLLTVPAASYLASPVGSVTELTGGASPDGVRFAKSPVPPFWRTTIACDWLRMFASA